MNNEENEKDEVKGLRYSVAPELYAGFLEVVDRTNMGRTGVLNRLIRFLLLFDSVTQSTILQSVKVDRELTEFILARLAREDSMRIAAKDRKKGGKPRKDGNDD